jgi:dCMP deaminase
MNKWDQHFIDMCLFVAQKSKDPSTQVGAVIVGPDNEVRGTGYNGLPRGIRDTPIRLHDRDMKLKLVVHAEMNAILAAARVGIPVKGCTMYVLGRSATSKHPWGGPPCTRCAVEMIQAGITQVRVPVPSGIPERWQADLEFSKSLLQEAGVKYVELEP